MSPTRPSPDLDQPPSTSPFPSRPSSPIPPSPSLPTNESAPPTDAGASAGDTQSTPDRGSIEDLGVDSDGDDGQVPDGRQFEEEDIDEEIGRTFHLDEIRIANDFIKLVKGASIGDAYDKLDPEYARTLRNPPQEPLTIHDNDVRLSLDIYLALWNASQESYNGVCDAIRRRSPEVDPLSFYQVQRKVAELSGVVPIVHDMCVNSCIAFTGPWSQINKCPKCGEVRYDLSKSTATKKSARQQYYTLPLGPQLQALWRTPQGAENIRYRERRTKEILDEIDRNGNISEYDDIICGTEYLDAVRNGQVRDNDMVLMLSIDGAQLYQKKDSDCWMYIWIVIDHDPTVRYKKKHVLPGGFIPKKPKHLDSFLFPGLHHLSAIQKSGLQIWDAAKLKTFLSHPYFILGSADSPAMASLSGFVGHHGKNACRLYCPLKGRRKHGKPHYCPARLKPIDYDVEGCSHPDVPFKSFLSCTGQLALYQQNLRLLESSHNKTTYESRRLETGICKPSIFTALPRSTPIPKTFCLDIMHLAALNCTELLIKLWRGTLDCDPDDSKRSWDWAVLKGDVWKTHGKTVGDTLPYLPGSFDRPPRNPAEKISSGYKAWEFLMYIYGLGPGVFYRVLPDQYWKHLCKLIYGIRIIYQKKITTTELRSAHKALLDFANDFEVLYYQRKASRLHMVRPSIHVLTHLAPEIIRLGPGICYSQWTMERVIGYLTSEIKQDSNPYANLSQRGLRRSQVNALYAMVPDLERPGPDNSIPRGGIDLGDGYVLLRAMDRVARPIQESEVAAIEAYIQAAGGNEMYSSVVRWARLRLPNGQVARSAWKEKLKPLERLRTARDIKVSHISVLFTN